MKARLKNNQGIAMVVVIVMMVILLSITGAALLFSGLSLKASANLKSGSGAIHAADAGIQHGLALIPTGTEFDSLLQGSVSGFPCGLICDGTINKPTLTGSLSDYTYTVVAENDPNESASPTNDTNKLVTLTSTATGPNSSQRKIRAYVGRSTSSWTPPGAVYYPGTASSQEIFDPSGTLWTVTGVDTNYDNTTGSQPSLPGIAATSSGVVSNVNATLNSDAKRQRVQGSGYSAGPPVVASVQQTSIVDDVNWMAQQFIGQVTATTCPPKCLTGLTWNSTACPSSSPCTLGTDASPQITYLKGEDSRLDGYINGSGVLVVEGEIRLGGNFNFHGIVISVATPLQPGAESEFKIIGNAKIYGAVLLGPNNENLEFEIEGSGAIRYSSQAISMVRSNWGTCCLTRLPPKLIAWHEVMQ